MFLYYISKLVRTLWLVNLADRILLRGPLKFKVLFVAEILRDLLPNFRNFIASKSLKRFQIDSFCFRPASEILKPFLINGNRFRTRQTQNRDIINILLTSFTRSVL